MFHHEKSDRCLPAAAARPPRRLEVPPAAWDTHAHVIGLPPDYPLVAERHYTPPAASPAAYMSMLDTVGLSYGVLVQVSVHGIDNRLLLEALRTYPDRLRGIAVIDTAARDADLDAMRRAGVVGIRILDIVGGGVGLSDLEVLAARCAELGWHVQVGLKGESFPALVPRLLRLPVRFVIDHMGWCASAKGTQAPEFQAVLHLVRNTDCVVKLSGAFRLSGKGRPYADTVPFARALIEAAPDRLVWGSDWPHVGLYSEAERPHVGELLDLLGDYSSDADVQHRILVANPARIYGVPRSE